ncbi:MAG: ribonuclease III [Candidatus Kerfeldbacteria bacterium RIFCSPHIGHO2_02_FULL_42_14]|uniref:Ribonuclease 3 n=1 Tax=Candidatus Kerfeldbacteria bacterium RIFCSPHIGHO2_02_FULL_42_14 TaxID=1798540 RepID=A0A1G2ASX5_9BACT|nr:MAG: ribonuclease III [Candidatus Kerfeldbacteria bacterium RIFCSPHIGHO2_02_FULL_42_14]OGY81377.1 MAG: ribonuclease III [Candidatus Kerfeldbacteria bacterium RIFCSPHIGHO2_12_FULL_42_13]OGY83235.1 MAG: ribonuclease III [Candidatus Kerfeldbacteria bacterium RIFCSPLOWO2_02_FULL_42_19]OGY85708.1 MAG: ribonuclease III [Candidatus Kerfeldbacteria bacterium RIFCSPLOWO2_12_FULL_43_9]
MPKDIQHLEKILHIFFKNPDLLQQALIHRSYLNEHRDFPLAHNERLEFLGDAVLELIVTEYLYNQYPDQPEGGLTNWRASLVNSQMLATIAARLTLNDFLYLSRGEAKDASSKARQTILANAFEAVLGAMYLDQGWEVTKQFILQHVLSELPQILSQKLYVDPKSRFQEVAQEKLSFTPEYRVLHEEGPDHAKHFTVGVYLGRELIASGEGTSKQEAQIQAAAAGLKIKNW